MMLPWFSGNTSKSKLTPERRKKLRELCRKLGIQINALSQLDRALTHSSSLDRSGTHTETYERLEFLGDSILNASMAYILFEGYPNMTEGGMSAYRSSLVDERTLSEIAEDYGILSYINLGKGESLSDIRAREKVTADIMESIIGVIFLEKGFKRALRFVRRIMEVQIKNRVEQGTRDYKTQLQKWAVAKFREYPQYTVVNEIGPDHNKVFEVRANVANKFSAVARGRTKKEAEQKAAEKIWTSLRHERDE